MRAIAQVFGCLQHFLARFLAHMPRAVSIEDIGHRRSGDACFTGDIHTGVGGSQSRSRIVVFLCHRFFLGNSIPFCLLTFIRFCLREVVALCMNFFRGSDTCHFPLDKSMP